MSFYSCNILSDNGDINLIANAGEDQTIIAGSYAVFDYTASKEN